MVAPRLDRPYLVSWLRRTRKQLAPSGRLSEVALILSQREGGQPEEHAERLRSVLDGETVPSLDELTGIDMILSKPTQPPEEIPDEAYLF